MASQKKSKANTNPKDSSSRNKKKGPIKASNLRFKLGGVSAVVNFDRLIEHLKMTTSKSLKSPNLYLIFKEKEWDPDSDPDKPTLKVLSSQNKATKLRENRQYKLEFNTIQEKWQE